MRSATLLTFRPTTDSVFPQLGTAGGADPATLLAQAGLQAIGIHSWNKGDPRAHGDGSDRFGGGRQGNCGDGPPGDVARFRPGLGHAAFSAAEVRPAKRQVVRRRRGAAAVHPRPGCTEAGSACERHLPPRTAPGAKRHPKETRAPGSLRDPVLYARPQCRAAARPAPRA
jgi:hypothetical protein